MNEELIEKARLAFVEAWESVDDNWPSSERPKGARSRAGVEAAWGVFSAAAVGRIRDYWDANGELIESNNGARLAFDAIAAQIEELA